MRIAVVNWSRRKVGGIETYLSLVIPELIKLGHTLSFWHEVDAPRERDMIELLPGVPSWCVADLGPDKALSELREWRPDLIYAHGIHDPSLEAETLKIAPSILFAHAYHGTCVSGGKCFKWPAVTPCDRRLGWQCLVNYYPRRCGGLSPVTMLNLYRTQVKRLRLLKKYGAVLTHSAHLRDEYVRHGVPAERVHNLSYYASGSGRSEGPLAGAHALLDGAVVHEPAGQEASRERGGACRLLFVGRMEKLKGGHVLIEALPRVRDALGRDVRLTLAGDGPQRRRWESRAAEIQGRTPGVSFEFAGWLSRDDIVGLYAKSDLLVFPSLWPEPFGLAGPEAGLHGLPTAAFAVGGISEWLVDGVNGYMAPADPPTAAGLADSIVQCLRDPVRHQALRRGAVHVARKFNLKDHLAALVKVMELVLREGSARRSA